MESINITGLTPEQEAVVYLFINEGKLRAYDELRNHFQTELQKITPDDSHHGAYIEYVIEQINDRFNKITGNQQE